MPFCGFSYPREDLQQCTFSGTVAADNADDFTAFYLEGNVLQGPDCISGERRAKSRELRVSL
jgi:hypothetical protein